MGCLQPYYKEHVDITLEFPLYEHSIESSELHQSFLPVGDLLC